MDGGCSCSQIIGILAVLDRFLSEADERGNTFVMNFLEKQQTRLKALFDRHVVSIFSASPSFEPY